MFVMRQHMNLKHQQQPTRLLILLQPNLAKIVYEKSTQIHSEYFLYITYTFTGLGCLSNTNASELSLKVCPPAKCFLLHVRSQLVSEQSLV